MPLLAPQRVIIVSASIGGGHYAAGRALERECLENGLDVQHVDMLDYTTAPFRRLYRQTYFDLVRTAPDLVDWLGKRLDRLPTERKTRQQRIRARLTRMISYRLPHLITRFRADVLVHTHFLPPEILSALGKGLTVPQAVAVTDFAAHSLWLQPKIKRYFVASDDVAVHLQSAGVEPARVRVTGIPIDPVFGRLEPRPEARARLGIPADRDTLLVMAGGLDKKTLFELVRQLKEFRWPLTAAIICGRSADNLGDLRDDLEGHDGLVQFRVLGFSDEVPHYMAAADLVVGKPGGLTCSEALAAGLPVAVVQPYPIQEEANANYLLEHGAAMRIEPLSLFGHKLKSYFEDAERRAAMRAAARKLARPSASHDIVRSLLEDPLEN